MFENVDGQTNNDHESFQHNAHLVLLKYIFLTTITIIFFYHYPPGAGFQG